MPDPLFYSFKQNLKLSEIAKIADADFDIEKYEDVEITSISSLEEAEKGDIAYCDNVKNSQKINTQASAIFISEKFSEFLPENVIPLFSKNPRASFALASDYLFKEFVTIDDEREEANIEDGAIISKSAIIGKNVQIGKGTIIGANCVIHQGTTIGRNCFIDSNVSIKCANIGDNVTIGASSIIGKKGFGVVPSKFGPLDVPHFGGVIIQDKVSIGSLCTIDRGSFGNTVIGLMSKIDNHCHIGHNCKLGQGVIIAAFGGISGSVEIADFVMMGGRVGVADHFKVGAGAKIGAGAAVLSDVPAGETFVGYPAKSKGKWLRETIALSRLTDKPKK